MDRSYLIFKELKSLGVKVSKSKKLKSSNLKHKSFVSHLSQKGIFGVNLSDQEWISVGEEYLPKFLVLVTTHLEKHLTRIGLFRAAGSVARQRKLKQKLADGVDNLEDSDPYDVGAILKQWLRELPESLIPPYLHDIFLRCMQLEHAANRVTACLLTCLLLPSDHLLTLKYLLQFLSGLARKSDENKMDAHNISLVMAPNVFILEVKKINNSAFQFASIMQLLIENADRVGEPLLCDTHYLSQDFKSCSELDSSTDILDASPKRKSIGSLPGATKRAREGKTHWIFDLDLNGLKKFVGQGTSTPSNLLSPEVQTQRRHSSTSSYKRKADQGQPATPAKKSKEEHSLGASTKNGGAGENLKPGFSRHSRRKTFDILRRKNKKRNKLTENALNPPNNNSTVVKPINPVAMPTVLVTDVNGDSSASHGEVFETPIPKITIVPSISFTFDKGNAITKSESDSHIKPVSAKPTSTSSLRLLKNPSDASSYNLRSRSSATSLLPFDTSVSSHAEVVSTGGGQSLSSTPSVMPVIETIEDPEALVVNKSDVRSVPCRRASYRKQGTITRQEAFIFKPKSVKNKTEQSKSIQKDPVNSTSKRSKPTNLQYSKSSPINGKVNLPKSPKKPRRKESSAGSKHPKANNSLEFKPLNFEAKYLDFKEIDFSLTLDFENLMLSPPLTRKDDTSPSGQPTPLVKSAPNIPNDRMLRTGKKSLTPARKTPSTGNKISRLGSTGSIRTPSSESSLKLVRQTEERRSDSRISQNYSRNSAAGLSDINVSQDNSCFKTPSQCSMSSVQWISASKYLNAMSPECESDVPNKRESIAMILRNKGHVQEKVSIYDTRVRSSMYATRSCSTPLGGQRPVMPGSEKTKKELSYTRSCDSTSVNRARAKVAKMQSLPPPPKFTMPPPETPEPKPLRELTNLNRSHGSTPTEKKARRPLELSARHNSFSDRSTRSTDRSKVLRSNSTPGHKNRYSQKTLLKKQVAASVV